MFSIFVIRGNFLPFVLNIRLNLSIKNKGYIYHHNSPGEHFVTDFLCTIVQYSFYHNLEWRTKGMMTSSMGYYIYTSFK